MYSPPGPNQGKPNNNFGYSGAGVVGEQNEFYLPQESDVHLGSGATGSTNVIDPNRIDSPLNPRSDSITRHYATSHGRKRTKM